jgi:hypothetical protein
MRGVLRDLTGQKFGRLTVLARAPSLWRQTMWLVRCSCSREKVVRGYMLLSGRATSCGCLRLETVARLLTKHGHASRRRGQSPEYRAWRQMHRRCSDEAFVGYKIMAGEG